MDNTYKTKDLAEASTLLTLGQKIISIERENNICWFIFNDLKTCQKISNDFWFGECLVDARSLHDSTNKLKNRIFSS